MHLRQKPVEQLRSGHILVVDGSWYGVHGLVDNEDGTVTVNSDFKRGDVYKIGTLVTVA
jgi:hypothetical protein